MIVVSLSILSCKGHHERAPFRAVQFKSILPPSVAPTTPPKWDNEDGRSVGSESVVASKDLAGAT